ncbi:hypothetical protein MRX96_012105 [Rhipicephalus microplus]
MVLHTNAVNTPDPDAAASRPEDEQLAIDVEVSSSENPQEDHKSMSLFSCLEVPSPHWTKHIFPDHKGIVYCTSVLTPKNEVRSEKVVMFFESRIASYCKVFIRGSLLKEGTVETEETVEEVPKTSDRMCIFVGAISHEDYEERFLTKKLKDHVVTCNEMYFSIKCLGQVDKRAGTFAGVRGLLWLTTAAKDLAGDPPLPGAASGLSLLPESALCCRSCAQHQSPPCGSAFPPACRSLF